VKRETDNIPFTDYRQSPMMHFGSSLPPEPTPLRGGLTSLGVFVLMMASELLGVGVGWLIWGW